MSAYINHQNECLYCNKKFKCQHREYRADYGVKNCLYFEEVQLQSKSEDKSDAEV